MAAQARSGGFWRGVFTGLVVAAVLAAALAWLFPPLRAPEIPPGTLDAPAAPGTPVGQAAPQSPGQATPPAPVPSDNSDG